MDCVFRCFPSRSNKTVSSLTGVHLSGLQYLVFSSLLLDISAKSRRHHEYDRNDPDCAEYRLHVEPKT
ncbi:uncharacterized protein BDW43DRAFT_283647 [Aspergillus alliaceus]|uniref:uncharacterized protein n=1 Tax=Petromyces alliaceus TaxID=209559 RepID=UPI0012A57788|nr:uncharacterized protein BDW43DRAFT_283647 [Aspergillus alliaceus]KAB8231110.1 hypothetical protein BDW43DRAFT_283647 [Aspergillus alliaceus]